MATWSQPKTSLISHLIEKGLEPAAVPGFIRCLAFSVGPIPDPDIVGTKQRMRRMGWTECEIDDDTLTLARACFVAEGLDGPGDKPARWFEKNFNASGYGNDTESVGRTL